MPIGSGGTSTTARPISWRPAGGATRSHRPPRCRGCRARGWPTPASHARRSPRSHAARHVRGRNPVRPVRGGSGAGRGRSPTGDAPALLLAFGVSRLPSNRRSFEPRVRRVGVRGRGARAASSRAAAIRSRHRSRLRSWLRLCESLTRSSAPSAARIRARRTSAVTTAVRSTAAVTFVELVLTCCPPGPPERANVHRTAVIGTTMPSGVVRSASRSMAVGRAGERATILPDPRPAPPLVQGAAGRIRDSHPGSDCSSAARRCRPAARRCACRCRRAGRRRGRGGGRPPRRACGAARGARCRRGRR